MISGFIITFRETLEAALIVGIILSYLLKTNQSRYNNIIYLGVVSGIVASLIGAFLFSTISGGLVGRSGSIFEGITTIIGAFLLTTMILWIIRQKHIARKLEKRVSVELTKANRFGLFFLVFIAILREGIETVIFLSASGFVSKDSSLFGALFGVITAVLVGFAMFVGSLQINIKRFFNITSVLLIFFAAGLVAYGIHELQEANLIPTAIEHVWNINPSPNADGSYPLFHEKGGIGSILKGLFGYNGNPSLLEILGYIGYLAAVFGLWRKIERNHRPA